MKLTVYSSKNCPRCKALKKWLRRNKLSFIEKSLDDTDVMTELVMRNLFVLSTPALETENTVYLSDQIFDADNRLNPELKELLRSKPVKKKIVECSNCRKEVEVPDDIDPEQVAVFCSKKCSYAEAGW